MVLWRDGEFRCSGDVSWCGVVECSGKGGCVMVLLCLCVMVRVVK